jgi:hypothetical protein
MKTDFSKKIGSKLFDNSSLLNKFEGNRLSNANRIVGGVAVPTKDAQGAGSQDCIDETGCGADTKLDVYDGPCG